MTSGVESATLVKEILRDPYYGQGIRTMMMLLKQFLAQRLLNEVYSGGLGSFALVMLITAFFKVSTLV
jgi:DNA polymerase sigma